MCIDRYCISVELLNRYSVSEKTYSFGPEILHVFQQLSTDKCNNFYSDFKCFQYLKKYLPNFLC